MSGATDFEKAIKDFAEISSESLRSIYGEVLNSHGSIPENLITELIKVEDLTEDELLECFNLVKTNLYTMYKNSAFGWSSKQKQEELKEEGLIYILLKSSEGNIKGFGSFMITIEDKFFVIYCYELQLHEDLRGNGLGSTILAMIEDIGFKSDVKKSMLTVFSANPALNFYRKKGYELADHSPRERTLRRGIIKEPSYYIMSKDIKP
ncbi:acyl-CoA N-acyltransferase [Dipodascopsis uninucleata]